MEKEPFKDIRKQEFANLESLVNSGDWKTYLVLQERHKTYLTKQCLICVLKADFHNAVCHAAKVEDVDKQIALISMRIKELRKEGEKDG